MTELKTLEREGGFLSPLDPNLYTPDYYQSLEARRKDFLKHSKGITNIDSLLRYLEYLKGKYKPSTYETYKSNLLQSLKTIPELQTIEAQEKLGRILKKTKVKLNHDKTQKTFSEEFFGSILEKANSKEKLFFQFLYFSGCRVSEMLSSRHDHSRTEGGLVFLTIVGKGRIEREIMIPIELYSDIKEVFRGEKYLFEHNKKKYSRQFISKLLNKYSTVSQRLTPHMFRHSRGTNGLQNHDMTIRQVQSLLGHRDVRTTILFYDHTKLTQDVYMRGIR